MIRWIGLRPDTRPAAVRMLCPGAVIVGTAPSAECTYQPLMTMMQRGGNEREKKKKRTEQKHFEEKITQDFQSSDSCVY